MEEESKKVGLPVLLVLTGLGIASLFVWLFAELAEEVLENEMKSFDNSIINFFEAIETSTLDIIYIGITELGSVWFLTTLSVLIILLLWFKAKDKWGILFFVIAVAGSGLLTWLLKQFYERGRPSINEDIDAIGFSFPSGHSMGSLVFYGFLAYLIARSSQKRAVKYLSLTVLGLLIILIGTSRIYLGAHFPSDVLAGFIAGTVWLLLCLLALEWVQWQSNSPVRPVHALRKFLIRIYKKGKQKVKS
ncbi:phosphatase PAP2 family protein [Planococcus salinarum]|uniref:phosphatase PAP2 family protein n=1 Tax=Planococcus salinarum TaxID=622695 RepID=UPI000E3D4B8F|nr:phosphatase PAP2 family protein [Planococcus salinarum]TAA73360.1 phosphatase PAP2 family protein [Planococcus salinarum]